MLDRHSCAVKSTRCALSSLLSPLHPPTRRPILPCRNGKSLVAHFALHCDGDPEPVELSLAEVCGGAGCQRRWSDVRVCDVHAQPVFGGRAVELAASRSKSVVRKGGAVWPLTAALYSDVSRWPAFVARRPNFHAWLDYHAAQGVGCFFVYEARDATRLSRLRARVREGTASDAPPCAREASEEGAELLREWTASARGGCAVALPWRFVPRGGSKRFLALPKDFVTQEISRATGAHAQTSRGTCRRRPRRRSRRSTPSSCCGMRLHGCCRRA